MPYNVDSLKGKLSLKFEAEYMDPANLIPPTVTKNIPAKMCEEKDYSHDPELLEAFRKLYAFYGGQILCPQNLDDIPMFGDHGIVNPKYMNILIEKCSNPNAGKPWKTQIECLPDSELNEIVDWTIVM